MTAPLDRPRLARVLALLGSPVAGERDAAVLAAGRMLDASGVRWEALAEGGGATATQSIEMAAMVALLQAKLGQADRKADELRASVRRYGAENAALKRKLADVEARLEVERREVVRLVGKSARKAAAPRLDDEHAAP